MDVDQRSRASVLAQARAPGTMAQPRAGQISRATSVEAYRIEVARQILARNQPEVFEGPLPNPLRAVVILQIEIDASGQAAHIRLLRSPELKDLEARAMASVTAAAPFARPAPSVLRSGRVQFLETWLFDQDERFQLRSLSAPA